MINNVYTLRLLIYLNKPVQPFYDFTSQSSYVRTESSKLFSPSKGAIGGISPKLPSQVMSMSVELWLLSRFYLLISLIFDTINSFSYPLKYMFSIYFAVKSQVLICAVTVAVEAGSSIHTVK